MGYQAYNLTPSSKIELLRRFPPKFENVRADHVTYRFGVTSGTPLPYGASVVVVGYASNEHVECVVVTVDGLQTRPDGKTYHITLSFAQGASAKMSNDLLDLGDWKKITPFPVQADPTFNS